MISIAPGFRLAVDMKADSDDMPPDEFEPVISHEASQSFECKSKLHEQVC